MTADKENEMSEQKEQKPKLASKKKVAEAVESITAFKGFDKNLKCRDFQFEIGKEYTHDGEVKACESGFHSCEYPLDVFRYYAPGTSRFAVVTATGSLFRHGGDSKVASAQIKIVAEIGIPQIVEKAIEWITSHCNPIDPETPASSTGYQGAASSTGYQGAASSTGYQGAASSTGTCGAASSTGDYGAASSTGYQGAASSTGTCGAASSTGTCGAASSTGTCGAASSTGKDSVAMASGYQGKAKAAEGCAIFLVYRNDDYEIIHAKAAIVGENGIKPDVFYMLDDAGNFVEA